MSNIEWLCARCAEKTGKTPEPDPVVLRLCTECKVENWVRPFGHAGEAVVASEEEIEAAHMKASEEAKVMKAATEKITEDRAKERAEEVKEAKKAVTETDPEEEIPTDDATIEAAQKAAEIEALKKQLAELEK